MIQHIFGLTSAASCRKTEDTSWMCAQLINTVQLSFKDVQQVFNKDLVHYLNIVLCGPLLSEFICF